MNAPNFSISSRNVNAPNFSVSSRNAPRRVVLRARGPGVAEYEIPPLGATWLAGQLMGHALGLLNPSGGLGVNPTNFAQCILWEQLELGNPRPGWTPRPISSTRELFIAVAECKRTGTPYRVTVDMITDPLEAPEGPGQ